MTSTVISRTSQGNQGAHSPLYITALFVTGHAGVRPHYYPSPSTVMTGSLKCHPQRPKDDSWLVIGSARLPGCYGAAETDFYTFQEDVVTPIWQEVICHMSPKLATDQFKV